MRVLEYTSSEGSIWRVTFEEKLNKHLIEENRIKVWLTESAEQVVAPDTSDLGGYSLFAEIVVQMVSIESLTPGANIPFDPIRVRRTKEDCWEIYEKWLIVEQEFTNACMTTLQEKKVTIPTKKEIVPDKQPVGLPG